MPDAPERAAPHPWPLRHVTKLLMGAGLVVLLDSRTTQWLVDAPDPAFDYALEEDTPSGWRRYVEKEGSREKAQTELARLHQRAIVLLRDRGAPRPDAIGPWLAVLRDRVDERVAVDIAPMEVDRASFAAQRERPDGSTRVVDIADALPAHEYACVVGIDDAFERALGGPLVELGDFSPPADAPRITVQWSARANGGFYGGGASTIVFPGIEVTASLALEHEGTTLGSVEATVEPGADFTYSTFGPALMVAPDVGAVTSGMVEAACTRLGERWIEELVGMPPAIEGEAESLEDRCTRGDTQACIVYGEDLRSQDPAKALEVLETGCRRRGLGVGRACMAAAELALERGDEEGRFRAEYALGSGCDAHDADACSRAADVIGQRAIDPERRREAYLQRLRACDLGDARACIVAATEADGDAMADGPAPWRAALLAQRGCAGAPAGSCTAAIADVKGATIHGVAIPPGDTAFAIHWGMWWSHSASEIVWLASASTRAELASRLVDARAADNVRVYAAGELPHGIAAPTDATSVYAIASTPRVVVGGQGCPECAPEALDSLFWPPGCACLPR